MEKEPRTSAALLRRARLSASLSQADVARRVMMLRCLNCGSAPGSHLCDALLCRLGGQWHGYGIRPDTP